MRLRKRDLVTVYLKRVVTEQESDTSSSKVGSARIGFARVGLTQTNRINIPLQDDEGNDIIVWGNPIPLKLNVQSASGKINAAIYGSKLSSMKSCKYQGFELKEGRDENSGVCLYVDKESEPDYKITSIQPFSTHINIMLERNDDYGR